MIHYPLRANSAHNSNPPHSKTHTSVLDNYLDTEFLQSSIAQESFEPLPRFRLVPYSPNAYGAFELELMTKADKLHIPYNKTNPDFCDLENDIYEYEKLIERTIGLEIDWDYAYYDPIGLEQAINDAENREGGYARTSYRDYNASRGVL